MDFGTEYLEHLVREMVGSEGSLVVGNMLSLAVIIAIARMLSWELMSFLHSLLQRIRGTLSERKSTFLQAAHRSLETPGFFAAYSARRTVVVTANAFSVTILFNVANLIGQISQPSLWVNVLRISVTTICVGLTVIAVLRLSEIYIVSKLVLGEGRADV
jgi:hypothetical protein